MTVWERRWWRLVLAYNMTPWQMEGTFRLLIEVGAFGSQKMADAAKAALERVIEEHEEGHIEPIELSKAMQGEGTYEGRMT